MWLPVVTLMGVVVMVDFVVKIHNNRATPKAAIKT